MKAAGRLPPAIEAVFPDAMPLEAFLEAGRKALAPLGFRRENAIACVGLCRDERTRAMVDAIHACWGEAFNFSSLGGMLLLGKTGFRAALGHAPNEDGRERPVFFAMPHLAISEEGGIGRCARPGRKGTSAACGALRALLEEIEGGGPELELDPDDLEYGLLKRRLHRKLGGAEVSGLVELTRVAHEVVREDLETLISRCVDVERCDFAVFTGIQLHGDGGAECVWPGARYAVVGGERRDLDLRD